MPDPEHRPAPTDKQPARPRAVAIFLVCTWVLLGAGLAFSGRITSRADYDQKLYHLAAIRQFAQQWPNFDFWHYMSATTPGYHLLMAAVVKFVSPSLMALQAVAVLIAGVLLGLLGCAVGRRTTPLLAVSLCLPLLCNMYFVDSGAWLLPDDLGWLGVLVILLIALRPKLSVAWMFIGGVILLGLVFVRQSHLWAAAMLWASAWVRPTDIDAASPDDSAGRVLFWNFGAQLGRTLVCFLCTLPAVALVALFWRYWGGPVPPVFQGWFHGANTSGAALVFATFGAYGVFLLPIGWPHLCKLWSSGRARAVAAALGALVYSIVVPTNGDRATGRRSGLWDVATKLKFLTIADHTSLLIVGLVVLGVVLCAALISAAPIRQRIIFLTAMAGFIAASSSNSDLFQRYVDPMALIMLAILGATAAGHTPKPGAAKAAGPLLLAAAFFAMTASGIIKTDCRVSGPNPPSRTPSAWDIREVPCDMPRPPMPPDKHFWP